MDLIKRDDAISAVDVFSNTASVLNLMELPAVDAIPRDRIEQIKAELTKDYVNDNPKNFTYTTVKLKEVLDIIDKYTKEQNNEQ